MLRAVFTAASSMPAAVAILTSRDPSKLEVSTRSGAVHRDGFVDGGQTLLRPTQLNQPERTVVQSFARFGQERASGHACANPSRS
jgi:hypothetical protein